jgi:hypothetical protein
MRIEVTRTASGGGLRRAVRVDSDDLPPEHRKQLTTCVRRLDIDDLEAQSPLCGLEGDRFRYEITFREKRRVRHVIVDESRLSKELEALLELLLDG